jgi:hypothetical protein
MTDGSRHCTLYVGTQLRMFVCIMYVCMCICVYVFIYEYIYVFMYVGTYRRMYVCVKKSLHYSYNINL